MALPPLSLPLKLLAGGRLLAGASSWLLPFHTSRVFALLTLEPQYSILMRVFGAREVVLAGLLIAAGTQAERRRMVLAGLVVDGMDVLASLVGYGLGEQEPEVTGMLAVGAALLMGLGLMGRTG